jgi:hypothetical protein
MTENTNSGSSRRWELITLLILFAIVAISRFTCWEISFWEWDEYQYANALYHFNVWQHSPHPPGYPGYVALTRCFNYFLHSDVKALALTNAFFGSLFVFPLYFLYRQFSSYKVALGAAALALFNPIIWYESETGYSDMTSLFWVITSLALLYQYESNRRFYFGMLSMGIAMSIRPQNVWFGILLVPLFLWRKLRRGEIKPAGIGLGLLVAMCLAWFVPLVHSAGGLQRYMELMRVYGAATGLDPGYLNLRHEISLYSYIKTKFALTWGSRPFALWMLRLTVLGMLVHLWRGHRKAFVLLMLGFLPMILLDFLFLYIYVPKYNMPTVVLVSFFVVYGLFELLPRYPVWGKFLAPALVLSFTVFAAQWTLPAVRHIHTIKSPPVQLFDYIREHLDPKKDAIVFDPRIKPLVPHHLPGFVTISRSDLDRSIETIRDMNWYYVGSYEPGIDPQVWYYLDNDRLRTFRVMYTDMQMTRMDILYCSEFNLEMVGNIAYRKLLKPEGHYYLRNSGRPQIFNFESALFPPGKHALPVRLELDGQPLMSTTVEPNARFDPFFLLKKPRNKARPFSTITIKTSPQQPGDTLRIDALGLYDIEPAPVSQTQIIDFTPADMPALVAGWSRPETMGETTMTWSEGNSSVLRVPMQPKSIYELSFRALPITRKDAPSLLQAVTVCLDNLCSPELELVNGEWQTHTRLILTPDQLADGGANLTFRYRFTHSSSADGSPDTRALGVAFDYVKLVRLGTRLGRTELPSTD